MPENEQLVVQLKNEASRLIRPEELGQSWSVASANGECTETIVQLVDGGWLSYSTRPNQGFVGCELLSAVGAIEWLVRHRFAAETIAQVLRCSGPSPNTPQVVDGAAQSPPKNAYSWGPHPDAPIMEDDIVCQTTALRRLGAGNYLFLRYREYLDFCEHRELTGKEPANLDQAATWLLEHGHELPEDLLRYMRDRYFTNAQESPLEAPRSEGDQEISGLARSENQESRAERSAPLGGPDEPPPTAGDARGHEDEGDGPERAAEHSETPRSRSEAPTHKKRYAGVVPFKLQKLLERLRVEERPVKGAVLAREIEVELQTFYRYYSPALKAEGAKAVSGGGFLLAEPDFREGT